MKHWSRYVVGVVAVTGLLVLVTRAGAETCALEIKKLENTPDISRSGVAADYLFRSTYPQQFFQQLGGPAGMIRSPGSEANPAFSEVIKKEPAGYVSQTPFRGVASLGTEHYGFVLDIAPPKEETKKEEKGDAAKDGGEKKPPAEQGEKGGSEGGLLSTLAAALGVTTAPKPEPKAEAPRFTRLYFDLNHNGDLTDEKVIEADSNQPGSMNQASFPVINLTIDVGGKKVDYAFRLSVYSRQSGPLAYAYSLLYAAAYRDGQIVLDGKKHRVVLVDQNSNGRFDDTGGVDETFKPADGSLYPKQGDFLYIDPLPAEGYAQTGVNGRYQVNKLIAWGERFYELKIDPSGDTLSLEPSTAPVGYLANPSKGFRAVIYGDQGTIEIDDHGTGKTAVPEGQWKLLSYTIQAAETPKPKAGEQKKEEDKGKQQNSIVELLASALPVLASTPPLRATPVPRPSYVSARAKADFTAVKIVAGETAQMPFGPPYRPQVELARFRKGQPEAYLSMSLIGIGGDVCDGLIVNGSQPSAPAFTISTKDGETVAVGKFQYG